MYRSNENERSSHLRGCRWHDKPESFRRLHGTCWTCDPWCDGCPRQSSPKFRDRAYRRCDKSCQHRDESREFFEEHSQLYAKGCCTEKEICEIATGEKITQTNPEVSPESSDVSWESGVSRPVVSSATYGVVANRVVAFLIILVVVHVSQMNNLQIIWRARCWMRLWLIDWWTRSHANREQELWINCSALALQHNAAHVVRC